MSNERFLIVAYFSAAAVAVLLSLFTWLLLRGPLAELARASRRTRLGSFLGRVFPLTLFLLAMIGFLSVSFFDGCSGHETYAKIVADRPWVESRAHEELRATLHALVVALFLWAFLLVGFLVTLTRHPRQPFHTPPPPGSPSGQT